MHADWPPATAGVPSEALRQAMAEFTAGVTVVTSSWQGVPHAMTATAFASVSLTPPLVLVCVDKRSRFHSAITQAKVWAVSILSHHQVALARHFSHSGRDLAIQFSNVPYAPGPYSGAPVLLGALVWLDCATFAEHDAGDHTIVVGRVVATGRDPAPGASATTEPSVPLTYHRGTYS